MAKRPDNPPQYCARVESQRQTPTREDLEFRVVQLWKNVWLGLYQAENREIRSHYIRLEALYLGTGLTHTFRLGELHLLNRFFSEWSINSGIASLKLFENLSILTLQSVVEILEAYEREIANLDRLFSILRNSQTSLHGTNDRQKAEVEKDFFAVSAPMERRIRQYDIRMNVLNMDICDEAMALGVETRLQGTACLLSSVS